jgi:hypothetical protein
VPLIAPGFLCILLYHLRIIVQFTSSCNCYCLHYVLSVLFFFVLRTIRLCQRYPFMSCSSPGEERTNVLVVYLRNNRLRSSSTLWYVPSGGDDGEWPAGVKSSAAVHRRVARKLIGTVQPVQPITTVGTIGEALYSSSVESRNP